MRCIQIGVGGWGQHWCKVVLPRLQTLGLVQVVAAVDINPEVLPRAREQLGLAEHQLYTDAAEALAEHPADFVTIVVPPASHEQMVGLAVAHKLHILSEKPIADTMEGCCRIYHKVRRAGLKMAVTMTHRFDQDKESLRRRIASGEYGRLDYIVGRNTWDCRRFGQWGKFRYRIPDPLLIEGTVHHFDIMRALAASNAKTVYARTWNPPWSEFSGDAQGLILVEMENGVKVMYEGAKANASTLNEWCEDYWRAECDHATLELDQRRLRVIRGNRGRNAIIEELPLEQQPAWVNSWLAEMFAEWLLGGPEPPNSLEDNIQCAALLFAAISSAHTGEIVDVQAFLANALAATA
ncbi:Gfo/Idh/MocA family oxidoreductase [bacterium]|nr:Gfo/Idh/MocA family oxidoreductase [bacterium]